MFQVSVSTYRHYKKSDSLFGHFQICPLCSGGDTNLWPQWLCRCVTRLSRSVVLYWSSQELSVFILTSVCINTPVTREQPLSDQITGSIKQTPLCGFGTQRSRPLAGRFSQGNSETGRESARQTKTEQLSRIKSRLSMNSCFNKKSDSNRGKEWFQNKSLLIQSIKKGF